MQKYGRTTAGVQRWRCLGCKKSGVRVRPDLTQANRRKVFQAWLTGNTSLTEVATAHGVTRRTLKNWFAPFWSAPPSQLPSVPDLSCEALVIDAVYLSGRFNAALIG